MRVCMWCILLERGWRVKPWQTESPHQAVKHCAGQWGLCPETQKLQAAWFKVPPSLSSTSPFHSNFSSQARSQYLQTLFPMIQDNNVFHSLLILFSLIFFMSSQFSLPLNWQEKPYTLNKSNNLPCLDLITETPRMQGEGRERKKYFLVGWFSGLRP